MKNTIIYLVLCVALFACTDENEATFLVEPDLEPYVTTFYTEAAGRGVVIPKNLVAQLDSNIQGITKGERRMEQNYLYFNEVIFNDHKNKGMETQIEALVAYRMASMFFGVAEPSLEMIASYNRETAFNAWVK